MTGLLLPLPSALTTQFAPENQRRNGTKQLWHSSYRNLSTLTNACCQLTDSKRSAVVFVILAAARSRILLPIRIDLSLPTWGFGNNTYHLANACRLISTHLGFRLRRGLVGCTSSPYPYAPGVSAQAGMTMKSQQALQREYYRLTQIYRTR